MDNAEGKSAPDEAGRPGLVPGAAAVNPLPQGAAPPAGQVARRPSLLARLRTFVHRNLVVGGVAFYYRRLYGMDFGRDVRISLGARLDKTNPQGIHIGDFTAVTSGAAILTHDFVNRRHADVHVGRNCFIGFGAVILPGVRIGDSVIVTANSVVGRDVPSNSVVMGNPARVVEQNIVTGPWGIRLDKGNVVPIKH